ncbi:MAG: class I SAM-dependent methyltransferase [Oscillospiraceae bacterium]|nr:class I SAM-dependent methyltransferase [Oscillospiraceae bacterium]
MRTSTRIIKATNKIFPKVEHPFNMQNDGKTTYARWQYERGANTIACYAAYCTPEQMFRGKQVLDMGCGAGGKSLYYASLGAEHVTGVEIVAHYEAEANALAKELGLSDRFSFVRASAFELPFADGSFDTIIMNDFFEHVSEPERALREAVRLLRPGGKVFINFPPYYHPTGYHMSDAINMPWVHLFFTDRQLIDAYKELVKGLPDEADRLDLRFSKDEKGVDQYTYINRMTLKRAKKIFAALGVKLEYYHEIPLRRYFAPLAKFPPTRELFVKMAVCVVGKQDLKGGGRA